MLLARLRAQSTKGSALCVRHTRAIASAPARLIALFGDMHFQEKGLPQIERTAKWLIDEVEARRARAAVCLGDILNTRDTVSVQAQSSALRFFSDMRDRLDPQVPIHVLLGNHDMALKHSRRISSLDGLAMSARLSSNNLFVHKESTATKVLGQPAIFIPYYHDPIEIEAFIEKYSASVGPEAVSETLVFGHLAIGGALQNIRGTQYKGGLSATKFSDFKKTFSGHFHIHQALGKEDSLVYVGSPMQFNFGDANQSRGLLLYDVDRNSYELIENPYGRLYLVLNDKDILESNGKLKPSSIRDVNGMHLRVKSTTFSSAGQIQGLRMDLLSKGALSVDYQKRLPKSGSAPSLESSGIESSKSSTQKSLEDLVPEYVAQFRISGSEEASEKPLKLSPSSKVPDLASKEVDPSALSKFCSDLISEQRAAQGSVIGKLSTFDGNISKLTIENFMSVNGELTLDLSSMHDGLWLIEGPNGSGKSSLFEAICWAHFGKFLRSEMSANDCVNANAKACKVTIEYSNGLIIERSRKRGSPDQLKVFQRKSPIELVYLEEMERGEIKHSQTRLNQLIGIDYDTFAQTVVLSGTTVQGFLSGSPIQRRALVESLMGLEILDAVQNRIQELRQSTEKEIGTLIKLAESLTPVIENLKNSEKTIGEKSSILKAEERALLEKVASLSFEKEVALGAVSIPLPLQGDSSPSLVDVYKDIAVIVASTEMADSKVARIRSLIDQLVAGHLKDSELALSRARLEIERLRLDKKLSVELAALQLTLDNLSKSSQETEAELNRIHLEATTKEAELEKAKGDLSALSEHFKVVKFWETAFEKRVRGAKTGFTSFRSFVFRDMVSHINHLLGLYTSQLAADYQGGDLAALEATLDSNLELLEHYGRRSTGERKRTDLALLLSLFEIARQRSGYHSKYLLLDEVFDALDVSGRGSVQSVLSTLAELVPKILFISHSDVAVGASLAGTIRTEMARDANQKPLGTRVRVEEY